MKIPFIKNCIALVKTNIDLRFTNCTQKCKNYAKTTNIATTQCKV